MTKYYYTYLVYLTNEKSSLFGHIYYGKHETNNLADGYKGSGKILWNYYKIYPNDYYFKILNLYNSKEELNRAEYELIEKHLGKPYCINLKRGGEGGSSDKMSEETKKKISDANKGRTFTEEQRYSFGNAFRGKNHSEETKKKLSESRKKYLQEHPEAKQKCAWSKGTKGLIKSKIKGKHRVYDNKELNIYHYE